MTTRRSIWWPGIIIASAAGAALALFGGIGPPIQPLIALWFLLICPGMAFIRLLEVGEPYIELTLALALSIALDALVAETLVLARLWTPGGALLVLICFSIAGAMLQLVVSPVRDANTRRAP